MEIKIFYSVLAIILISYNCRFAECACTSATAKPDVTASLVAKVVIENEILAYQCADLKPFSTGDAIIVSKCVGDEFTQITATCDTAAVVLTVCTGSLTPAPADAKKDSVEVAGWMEGYTCTGGKSWLTGEKVRISQCKAGAWTEILDICDEGCPVPRHCGDVAELGLTDTGQYFVVPSGNPTGSISEVTCTLVSTGAGDVNGGKWTYILRNTLGNEMQQTHEKYKTGFRDATSTMYFAGLNFLSEVSMPFLGDPVGMVLEVLFKDANDVVVAFASYGNFTVGSATDGYPITSLGKYHGTAGDGLCPHLGTEFLFNTVSGDKMWWGVDTASISFLATYNGSYLTNSMKWEPVNAHPDFGTITAVEMRIKTIADDQACPPMVGTENWWTSVWAEIPHERTVGTTIIWECIGELLMEGEEGKERSLSGESVCTAGAAEDDPPFWSKNVSLPCTIKCPDGFELSEDARVCFKFSAAEAPSFFKAAVECQSIGSSLANPAVVTDVNGAIDATGYYVAPNMVGQTAVIPAIDVTNVFTVGCSSDCTASDPLLACTKGMKELTYTHADCNSPGQYICQVPAPCPDSFLSWNGTCLKDLVMSLPSVLEAVTECNAWGSSLPFFQTKFDADSFAEWYFEHINGSVGFTNPKSVFIGLNEADETFEGGGLYNPTADSALSGLLLAGDDKKFRFMTINVDQSWSIHAIDLEENDGAPKEVICRYFGIQGCKDPAPAVGQNMWRAVDDDTVKLEMAEEIYNCYAGHYMDITDGLVMSNVSRCVGQFGGWYPNKIPDCLPIKVCNISLVEVPSELITNNYEDPKSEYLNSTVTYTCPENMVTSTFVSETNTTCEGQDPAFQYSFQFIPDCDKCLENVTVDNSINDYDDTALKTVLEEQMITCIEGHEFAFGEDEQMTQCLATGFNKTGLMPCYKACVADPPIPDSDADGVTVENATSNKIGVELTYNCTEEGYHFEITEEHPKPETLLKVTCYENGTWVKERQGQNLKCAEVCLEDPPPVQDGATTSWDSYSRTKDDEVTYTAATGNLFGNFQSTWVIKCNGTHWVPADGSSDSPTGDGDIFTSKPACFDDPPAVIGGTVQLNFTAGDKGFIGQTLVYACPEGEATILGEYSMNITCNSSALWTDFEDPDFECVEACDGPPPSPPQTPAVATYNFTVDFTEGVSINYHCEGGFGKGVGFDLWNNCTDGNWTYTSIPPCLTITTPGPTTVPPVVLETLPPYSTKYGDTTALHFGEIEDGFSPYKDLPKENEPYKTVNSVFGFGTGVALRSKKLQCMEKPKFVPEYKTCQINPDNCAKGLAFSMWVRLYFNETDHEHRVYINLKEVDRKYIITTGGNKKGRPGFSLYINKAWVTAVVSTGHFYYETFVFGPIKNGTWTNVGVRFNKDFGIELYVNAKMAGSTKRGVATTIIVGYQPRTMLLGCRKSFDYPTPPPTYSNFIDGDLDEIAIWEESINASRVEFFLGGFKANTSNIDSAEFASMLDNVNLADPQQQAAAADVLAKLVASSPTPTKAAPTASTTPGDTSGGGGDGTTPVDILSTMDAEGVENLKNIGDIVQKITDYSKTPDTLTKETADGFLKVLTTVSDIFKPDNIELWKGVQKSSEKVGGMQIVNGVTKWKAAIMKVIEYTNDTTPFCCEIIEKYLYSKSCKMTIRDLLAMGNKIQEPDYSQPKLKKMRKAWDGFIVDRTIFPTSLFTDERCLDRPITFDFTVYDTVSKFAVTPVNPLNLKPEVPYSCDARLQVMTLNSDRARDENGDIDTSQPLCEPDEEALKLATIMLCSEHESKSPAVHVERRKPLLFESVIETDIQERFCVWWNENITDYGAWDKSGCVFVETNSEYSKCACNNFGIFTILAENSEPIEVPDEPYWLTLMRYVLYSISILAVIIYIIIVIISGELKDQFHLIGVNLAVAILCGSLSMLISDLESIREERESCAIMGAMLQLFYGAVGAWMLGLAHASFKGITAGVIGGHLKGYMLICWGFPIALTGVPFLIFNPLYLGNDPRCFIAWTVYVKGVFFLPQTFFVGLGFFYAMIVLCNLSTPALRKDNLIEDYGSFCKGAAIFVMILSLTWAFAVFAYLPIIESTDFYPIFQVLNAIAGLCLLIFIGFGSVRFRSVLIGQAKQRREKLKNYAFGLPDAQPDQSSSTTNLVPPAPCDAAK